MLEIVPSRSGPPTASLEGISLHSPYDPVREARRFAALALGDERPSSILLLGAELGYLFDALKELAPEARILPVYYSAEIRARRLRGGDPAWDPGQSSNLIAFLRANLRELDLEGLKILEWPASGKLFPAVSRAAQEAVRQAARELRGSLVTTAGFGRRWIRNSLLNALLIERPLALRRGERGQGAPAPAVLIAASGPSLERIPEALRRYRRRFSLWALPSAVPCLLDRDLKPDLVVLTDPGFYAIFHLHSGVEASLTLAMPLSASPGSWRIGAAVLPLCQDCFFERILVERLRLPAAAIAPQGTVAASALLLAHSAAASPVIIAGLDLCTRDLQAHARPNAFDSLLLREADRSRPFESRQFQRAAAFTPQVKRAGGEPSRTGLALKTYSGWFRNPPAPVGEGLFRLNPSTVDLPAFPALDNEGLERRLAVLPDSPPGLVLAECRSHPSRPERRQLVLDFLRQWTAGIRECRKSPDKPLQDPAALDLLFFISPAALIEARKAQRLGDRSKARLQVELACREALDFLSNLESRIGGN